MGDKTNLVQTKMACGKSQFKFCGFRALDHWCALKHMAINAFVPAVAER
jgi:hypothetical protein